MRFIERHDVVRASFVLLLIPLLAAIGGCDGCDGDPSTSGTTCGGSPGGGDTGGTGGGGGTASTATGGGTGGTGMGGTGGGCTGGGAPGGTALVAVMDDTTPSGQLQNDVLTVFDPASPSPPLLALSGLTYGPNRRSAATSKSKKRLGVMESSVPPALRVFDENLQELVNVVLPNDYGSAIYPTEQAIFALTNKGTIHTGTILKLDSNGSVVASTIAFHGTDLVVDEDRQVVWSVGVFLTRADTDLSNEEKLHTFGWAAVSLDVDASGGVWAAERLHGDVPGSVDQLVHFDVNGNLLSGDTLPLPGSPMSVRVDRNSGIVWVAMFDTGGGGGVAYRDVNGKLNMVPGLTGSWFAVEPDPLDCSRVWAAASQTGEVVHVDTKGTVIQSLGGFSTSAKGLAVMLQGQ